MAFRMVVSWRACFWLLAAVGVLAAATCGLEVLGVVAPGALTRSSSRAEVVAGLAVGVLLQPFAWTALRHARLVIDDDGVAFLRFGVVCGARRVPWRDVRRYGSGAQTVRGVRRHVLLLERQRGDVARVNLSMYGRPTEILAELERRLGPPAPTRTGLTGVRFEQPL